jgi:deazaflavin-dependent oxidoreductase (nitroreductase family)
MSPTMRRFFWYLNRFFMVPVFRLGFAPLFCNPLIGYIMVLKTIGRKSGRVRYAPVNYAIYRGNIYCVSGGRQSSDWFRNALATPDIEVILPGGAIFGHVAEESDAATRRAVIRQVLINAGFAGFFEGYDPRRLSDEELARRTADMPLVRIEPRGLGSGGSDPGGWAWIWPVAATIAIIAALVIW